MSCYNENNENNENNEEDKYDYNLKDYRDIEIEYTELEDACYMIEEKLRKYRRKKSYFEAIDYDNYDNEYNNFYSDKIDKYNYKIENLLILKEIIEGTYDKLVFK